MSAAADICAEDEEWRTIPSLPMYQASSKGRVRSLKWNPPRILNGTIERYKSGRPMRLNISICINGKHRLVRCHNLVLESFVGPRPEGLEGCHNDGNPLNNAPSNLRWDTHQSNMQDMDVHGTRIEPPKIFGERHHMVTVTDADVIAMRKIPYTKGLYRRLAKQFNIAEESISRIYKRQTRTNLP